MKLLIKILACILAVVLLAAGIFWFNCRIINHRSFMAGLTDAVLLLQHRSDKFTYLDDCEEYIEEKAVSNLEPVVIDSAKFDISVRENSTDQMQAFVYNEQVSPAQEEKCDMSRYSDFKNKSLDNPEIREAYESLQPEYDIIQAMIDARKVSI